MLVPPKTMKVIHEEWKFPIFLFHITKCQISYQKAAGFKMNKSS